MVENKREQYPILSQIVRDVMAIQVSTVASESAFSAAGRVVDPYRSRLDPEMVQALICTKDSVAVASKGANFTYYFHLDTCSCSRIMHCIFSFLIFFRF